MTQSFAWFSVLFLFATDRESLCQKRIRETARRSTTPAAWGLELQGITRRTRRSRRLCRGSRIHYPGGRRRRRERQRRSSMIRAHQLTACVPAGLLPASPSPAADPPAYADIVAWTAKTVAERQPGPQDRRFDEIGWATEVRRAIALGKEHNRPIFLFTMDGRINTGRC